MRLAKCGNGWGNRFTLKGSKCRSNIPQDIEKTGKKSLPSFPPFVATCLSAVKLFLLCYFLISFYLMWVPSFFVGYGIDDKKRHMCVEEYAVFVNESILCRRRYTIEQSCKML